MDPGRHSASPASRPVWQSADPLGGTSFIEDEIFGSTIGVFACRAGPPPAQAGPFRRTIPSSSRQVRGHLIPRRIGKDSARRPRSPEEFCEPTAPIYSPRAAGDQPECAEGTVPRGAEPHGPGGVFCPGRGGQGDRGWRETHGGSARAHGRSASTYRIRSEGVQQRDAGAVVQDWTPPGPPRSNADGP